MNIERGPSLDPEQERLRSLIKSYQTRVEEGGFYGKLWVTTIQIDSTMLPEDHEEKEQEIEKIVKVIRDFFSERGVDDLPVKYPVVENNMELRFYIMMENNSNSDRDIDAEKQFRAKFAPHRRLD